MRSKLIAIWIGPYGVGLFAIFNYVLELLSTATQLNMRQSAVRDISAASHYRLPFVAGVVRWWGKRLGLLGAAIIILLSPLLSLISFGDMHYWWGFACLSVAMVAMSVTNAEQALLQGTSSLRALAKASIIGAVSGTVISIPLYYFLGESSIIPTIIIFAITSLIATMSVREVKSTVNKRQENIRAGRDFLRLGVYLTVSAVVVETEAYIFVSYLNRIGNEATVGIYQAGYTLVVRYTGIIFAALSMEYFPRIMKLVHRSSSTSLVVSHEILLILYVLAPMIVLFIAADRLAINILYTEAFMAALPFVTIAIGAMVFRAASYAMAYVIIARGDGKTYIATECTSAVITLALNITMYQCWGYAGLGLSYVISYIIYTLIIGAVYRRRYRLRLHGAVVKVMIYTTLITAGSILLKFIAWWAVLPMLVPACYLSYCGYRSLR